MGSCAGLELCPREPWYGSAHTCHLHDPARPLPPETREVPPGTKVPKGFVLLARHGARVTPYRPDVLLKAADALDREAKGLVRYLKEAENQGEKEYAEGYREEIEALRMLAASWRGAPQKERQCDPVELFDALTLAVEQVKEKSIAPRPLVVATLPVEHYRTALCFLEEPLEEHVTLGVKFELRVGEWDSPDPFLVKVREEHSVSRRRAGIKLPEVSFSVLPLRHGLSRGQEEVLDQLIEDGVPQREALEMAIRI